MGQLVCVGIGMCVLDGSVCIRMNCSVNGGVIVGQKLGRWCDASSNLWEEPKDDSLWLPDNKCSLYRAIRLGALYWLEYIAE
jgi:hypothetical protein